MGFSWNEQKRLKTIADRGLDFIMVWQFFDGRPVIHQPTPRHGEDRWKSTTHFGEKFYTVVWLWVGETRHVISMRRAHAQEIRAYRALHSD